MAKKKITNIKEILKFSEIDDFEIKKIFPKNIIKNLNKKYGKISFPFLGIALDDEKKILLLIHKSPEDAKNKKAIIMHSANVSKKDLEEIINIIEKK